jgi:hypothetical protein
MKIRGLFLVLLFLIILFCHVDATQCLSENDCPQCGIDGATVTKKSLNTGFTDKQILTCEYSGNDENVGKVTLAITCYENAGIARQWTDYYAGTGENPDKSQYAGLSGRSRWRCVSGGSTKGSGQTVIRSFGCSDFAGNGRFVATLGADGQAEYLSSDPVAEENRKVSAAQDAVKARIQKYKDCFAGFSPGTAMSPQEKTLHGMIIAAKPNGLPMPMKHAEIILNEMVTDEDWVPVAVTMTDGEGRYEIRYTPQASKKYGLLVNYTYRTDRTYFSLLLLSEKGAVPVQTEIDDIFAGSAGNDIERNIDLEDEFREAYKNEPWWDNSVKNPFGLMYARSAEALEFYKDVLREDVRLNLPLKIVPFVDDNSEYLRGNKAIYWFDKGTSTILIGRNTSSAEEEYQPINREYHEISHYAMTNALGRFPQSIVRSDIPIINHDGYVNPSTTDSWEEGFAHFMAVVIADHYGYSCGIDAFGYYEVNHDAWDYEGKAEELAVAGVLWDLYDGKAQDDACMARTDAYIMKIRNLPATPEKVRKEIDRLRELFRDDPSDPRDDFSDEDDISFTIQELWPILKQDHSDFTSVYDALGAKYPEKKSKIDHIFEMHGFYVHTAPGDGIYTEKEPYRDANKNEKYDPGEYFIDLPSAGSPSNRSFYRVGTATNFDRLWRRTTRQLPGHFIKVNNAVPYYTYTVEFPGLSTRGYYRSVRNNDGLIYVHVPPITGAKITVTADGVTTGNPLVFTSDQFNKSYMTAVKQGYYTSHDFKISGPVPAQPVTPDFSKGGLSVKKSAGLPDFLSPTSRVPLIVSVPVAIAVLLVLAYVLRKEL